ncbi:hypothetical protein DM02DRAFT_615642 [Periconia macrospinosa]|uniref:Zn(2)-C6 fungal-type domain-containing protein n=1 Tax=Periconia macrospinosa TaxID=97972 RepID=A0A2V1DKI5_9PLEO|nr:hypothetical protein DM02DRAFT_615642 [Periconia macrospinosa]
MSSAGVEKRGSATTVKACDSCRRRKRRCLWSTGARSCNYCLQLKEECTTTHVRKQRAKSQKKDRIVDYERRIKNLESLLNEKSATQPQVDQQPLEPADQSIPLSTWVNSLRSEVDAHPDIRPLDFDLDNYYDAEPDPVPSLASNLTSVNSSSVNGTCPPMPDNFEPSAEYQVEAALLQDPSFETAFYTDGLSLVKVAPEPYTCDAYLPSPELGILLLKEYLMDSNTVFPLYRPQSIVEHLRICYEGRSDNSALAWASVYVVFGLAHRIRGMSATATAEDDQVADWYLCKILPTVSGLLVAEPTFGLVQCLLGLAMLIRSSKDYTPHGLYVSTALRIAQSLAYSDHDDASDQNADIDIDQQRRVLWLAFIMDTEENIFTNLPTTHRRGDLPSTCPREDPHDALGIVTAAEGDLKINIFALRVQLVLIQSDAIEEIFSIRSRRVPPEEFIAKANRILGRLEAWHNNELFRRTPEQLMELLYRSDLFHTLAIEASYFATVFRIRAILALGMDPRINPFSFVNLTRISEVKDLECFKEADQFLGILSRTPHAEIGICWMLKFSIAAALVTALTHSIHALPQKAPSQIKIKEWSEIVQSMSLLLKGKEDPELVQVHKLTMMLFTRLDSGLRAKWLQEVSARPGGETVRL